MADLTSEPAWHVSVRTAGRWVAAERTLAVRGQRWVLGLTPVKPEVIALIVWRDGDVVAHARGTESAMCAAAHDWAQTILTDPPPAPAET